jgi:predicted porin
MGPGKLLLGYGQKHPDMVLKTKQASIGYEYSLSPRTYVYVDLSNKKTPLTVAAKTDSTVNHYSLGIHHNF